MTSRSFRKFVWNSLSEDEKFWALADQFSVPINILKQSYYHEECIVSLLLVGDVDPGSFTVGKSDFADNRLGVLYERIQSNPRANLGEILFDRGMGECRRLSEMIADRRGLPKSFYWNSSWHDAELKRISEIRSKFNESLNFLLDLCASDG